MINIYLSSIHCDEETDEVGDDEPYVLVAAVALNSTLPGIPNRVPVSDVVVYPFERMFTGRRAAWGVGESFWGIGGVPALLVDPDDAIFIVAMMENDDGDPQRARGIVDGAVTASLAQSLPLPRAARVTTLMHDVDFARRTPTGLPNFDDAIGAPQELRFTADELRRAESSEIVTKRMVFEGDGGQYTLMFNAHGRSWSPEQQGVGTGTSDGPVLAEFNGRLIAAWKGVPGDNRMFWSSFDGTSWSPEQQGVGTGTSDGPVLVEFNGRLIAAWKGVPGDNRMFWSSFDGTSWSPEQQGVGTGTSNGPVLVGFDGRLIAAWKGVPGDNRMFWSSFDGRSWSPEQQGVGTGTSNGPVLVGFDGRLIAAWKGVPGDNRMFWSSFDGRSWSPEQQGVGTGTSNGPVLVGFDGRLIAAWKGVPGDNRMFWSSFDGTSWSPEQQGVGTGTSNDPSFAAFFPFGAPATRLFAAWKGVPGDNRMFWSSFDGTSWSPEQQGIGTGTSNGPVLAGFNGRLIAAWKGVPGDNRMFWSAIVP